MSICQVTVAVRMATVAALAFPVHTIASAQSRVGVLEVNPDKTRVEFRLGGALHTTHGEFHLKHGIIKADSATGNAEGSVVVDAASGDSGDTLRDNRMKDSVLEARVYPEIIFSPQHIDGHLGDQGNFHAELEGVLLLHGGQHQMTIETQGTLIGDDLVATAHFSIPYVEWGLKDPSVLFLTVAKDVDIDIAIAGHVTWLAVQGLNTPTNDLRPFRVVHQLLFSRSALGTAENVRCGRTDERQVLVQSLQVRTSSRSIGGRGVRTG